MHLIELRSDNAAGTAPEILDAVARANTGSALAYGGDAWTELLQDVVRDVFEHAGATAFPVISGTAANALALASLCPPWGSVLCHETAHVLRSECGATSMFGGGAVVHGLPGPGYRLTPASVEDAFAATRWGDPHHSQPSVLSLTQPTDHGTLYTVDEVATLSKLARSRALRVHIDGARLANAVAALGCSPADLTWRAGVDVVSLGAMKNGTLSTDAIVSFDQSITDELVYRVKRAGHTASKMRFQSAQLEAYLTDGLWLRLARQSNEMMTHLAAGLRGAGAELLNEPEVNMLFVRLPPATIDHLEATGVLFYRMAPDVVRLVTSFQTTDDEIDEVLLRLQTA
jgi:threonine aldolase